MNFCKMTGCTFAACAIAAMACLGAASTVHALSPDLSQLDTPRLERLFWDCDARATKEALPPGDGALCASLNDALKERRFDGDFERMLGWWRDHKSVEHSLRGVAEPAPAEFDLDDPALQVP